MQPTVGTCEGTAGARSRQRQKGEGEGVLTKMLDGDWQRQGRAVLLVTHREVCLWVRIDDVVSFVLCQLHVRMEKETSIVGATVR